MAPAILEFGHLAPLAVISKIHPARYGPQAL